MPRHFLPVLFSFCFLLLPAQAQQTAATPGEVPAHRSRANAVPRLVKYAGQVPALRPTTTVEGSVHAKSAVSATFAIYAVQDGGAALWQETQNVALDADGRYSVLLGAASRDGVPAELFTTGEPRWLSVRVSAPGDAEGSTEQARVLLVSVPYALRAADSETLGGRAATDFVLREELAGWSGVAPGASDAPRAVGGTQGIAVDATGIVGRVPRVTAATGSLITYGDGLFFDDGNGVGLGTTSPVALLDLQLTTAVPRDTLSAAVTLNNSAPIPGAVVTPFRMTLNDQSTNTNLSKQAMRVIYDRNAGATGGVSVFDSAITLATFIRASAPYTYRALNVEGPRIFNGQSLDTLFGIFIEAPPANVGGQPAGTITNKFALVTAPGSGNVGIGTTAPAHLLEVSGGNIKLTGLGNSFIFPDGTVMSSAGAGPFGGTITGVTAGAGLTGGGTAGGVTLDVSFSGTGSAATVSRGDHNHNVTYLPLAGGTLTGALNGTSGTFTGAVAGSDANFTGNLTLGGAINGGFRVLTTASTPNIVGGLNTNFVSPGVVGATIAGGGGGGGSCSANQILGSFGVVAGGCGNQAGAFGPAFASVGGGEANRALAPWSTIGGGRFNTATVDDATIGGGSSNTANGARSTVAGGNTNFATNTESTVGGGLNNISSGLSATVGGGASNTANGDHATIGGGRFNNATIDDATVGGGASNTATGARSTVGGGESNISSGLGSTVPGGSSNTAQGQYSLAAGRRAKATHTGTFVWGDSTNADFVSTGADQFRVRATGGAFFVGGFTGDIRSEATDFAKFSLNHATGGVDQKKWQNYATTNSLNFTALNDAENAETFWLYVSRGTGTAISSVIFPTGNVGIGIGTPTERLHVNGNVLANNVVVPSSRRFKTNILPLAGALGLVKRLQGVTYTRKDDGREDIGFIAEDVGAVLPQVVLWEANGVDAKGLDYARLTAVLVEAVKEQQARNERLERELAELRAVVAQLAASVHEKKAPQ